MTHSSTDPQFTYPLGNMTDWDCIASESPSALMKE